MAQPPTERRDPATTDIDTWDTRAVLECINDADRTVPDVVRTAIPELVHLVDAAVDSLRRGGRVHYVGSGTSGGLGVLDAAELAPTYDIGADRFIAHHAGGLTALANGVTDVEDDEGVAAADAASFGPEDLVVGLAASGRTPYVGAALRAARAVGARTALVSCDPAAPLAAAADIHVCLDTGAEVVAGSTRMKAGTAQKLVLHSLSTAAMIRMGRTYSNLMVNMVATNEKLRGRALRMLVEAAGVNEDECAEALVAADGEVKVALVCLLGGVPVDVARHALTEADGVVRQAVASVARQ